MPDDTTPAAGDDALLDRLAPKIHSLINSALASHNKQADKRRTEDRDAFAKLLDEKLSALKPVEEKPTEGGGKGKKDVELASLTKNVETLSQQLNEERTARQTAERKNRDAVLQTSVTEALSSIAQIQGTPAKLALAALTSMGRIGYDDEGENPDKIVFRGEDGIAVDLAVGLKQWAKTEEAKIFQPASGTRGGSGARPGGFVPGGNGAKPTKEQQGLILNDLLDRNL